ncbi:MAG: glucosylglycerol-phosphate synthase [Brachymonas sp.]|nr:glucosylglycerol-phosphate synthase [Brachymonas sp.]
MNKAPRFILATDLDGTFLAPATASSRTTPELYHLLREHAQQAMLIFATGRAYESVLPLLDDPSIPAPTYILADVGATVLVRQGDGYTPVAPIQSEIADAWPGHEAVLEHAARIEGLTLQDVPQEYRCSFIYSHQQAVTHAREIADALGLDVLLSAGQYLDFLPKGVNKGSSLRKLVQLKQLPADRILAAGDTLNDLSLLQAGYRSVAVGNAEPALLEALAPSTVPTAEHLFCASQAGPDGILEAIHHFGLDHALDVPDDDMPDAPAGDADLVMVYHRQPFDEVEKEGRIVRQIPQSPNGIIPTLLGFFATGRRGAWVAWSEQASRNPEGFEVNVPVDASLYPNLQASRVALTAEDIDIFYKKFSKEAFWPVIFSFPERATFNEAHWQRFCEVNQLFAEQCAAVASPGAIVWLHDYNLWMTPAYLRELRPDLKICFFHHTAFPCADIFNILPWKRQIISSLLKCDYVGFHIPRYVENFVDVVRSSVAAQVLETESCAPTWLTYGCALGVETMTRQLQTPYGTLGVGAHPVGIDNEKVKQLVCAPESQQQTHRLQQEVRDRKIVLSIERLDYVKGPIEKMQAFEKFLHRHPEWHGRVTMINIVTPAAKGMSIYEETRQELDRTIGRINGRFAKVDWTPVRYFYRSLPFEELMAYYASADVAWITPLRDGLNLVCKEFVSAKAASGTQGVLVLSEFAGAAAELKGAVLTNPHDENSLIQSLEMALNMDEQEMQLRLEQLTERVQHYDVTAWGQDFLQAAQQLVAASGPANTPALDAITA